MKSLSCGFLTVSLLLLFLSGAQAEVVAKSVPSNQAALGSSTEPQQMEGFTIAGYGAKGEKTWEVMGDTMDMAGDDIKIKGITAHMYGKQDAENMVLTADNGRFDRGSGVVHLEDNVRAVTESGVQLDTDALDWSQKTQVITTNDKVNIKKDNITVEGMGIEAKPDMKTAKFGKDVTLTVEEDKKTASQASGSAAPEGPGQMVITCDGPLELDYEKQVAVFEKNVKVEGDADKGTMYCDKMTIRFSPETKQIDSMEAVGHVKIVRGENTSTSDTAVFTAAEKKLRLSGRPQLVIFMEEGSLGLPE